LNMCTKFVLFIQEIVFYDFIVLLLTIQFIHFILLIIIN